MTPQEAIEILEVNAICSPQATKFKKAVEVAKQALEKQIPKKPILKETQCFDGSTDDFVLICPVCNRTICREPEDDVIADHIKEEYPHCNCGQALDWSDNYGC